MRTFLTYGILLFVASTVLAFEKSPMAPVVALAAAGLGCMVGAVAVSIADLRKSDDARDFFYEHEEDDAPEESDTTPSHR